MISNIEDIVFPIGIVIVVTGTAECIVADGGNTVRDGNSGEAAAGGEGRSADGGDAVREGDRGEAAASGECSLRNGFGAVLHCITPGNGGLSLNQMISNIENTVFPIGIVIVVTGIVKCRATDGGDAVRDGDRGETGAVQEGRVLDGGDALGDRIRTFSACRETQQRLHVFGKQHTILGSIAGIAGLDGNVGEAAAVMEHRVSKDADSNGEDAIGDGDRGEVRAVPERLRSNSLGSSLYCATPGNSGPCIR